MFLDDAQVLIWVGIGVIPSIIASNAWISYLRARWGGSEGARRYLSGFYRLDAESLRPRLLETYLWPSPSATIRPAQRRLQWASLFLLLAAGLGWPVAGALSRGVSVPDGVARSLQVAIGVIEILWTLREASKPLEQRWMPTGWVIGGIAAGTLVIAFAFLAPASA